MFCGKLLRSFCVNKDHSGVDGGCVSCYYTAAVKRRWLNCVLRHESSSPRPIDGGESRNLNTQLVVLSMPRLTHTPATWANSIVFGVEEQQWHWQKLSNACFRLFGYPMDLPFSHTSSASHFWITGAWLRIHHLTLPNLTPHADDPCTIFKVNV